MAKVIKLKQSDVERIVEDILKEDREWKGSTDPEIMQLGQQGPEELSGQDEYETELTLGIDDEGNYYVMKNSDTEKPEVVAKTK